MSWLEKIVLAFLMVSLSAIFLISTTEVFRRYIIGRSFVWADELCRYILAYIAFLGGSLAYKNNGLVRLDLVQNRLGAKGKLLFSLVTNTIVLVVGILLLIRGFQVTFSPVLLRQLSMGLKIPMATMYAAIPIGFALLVLFALERYIIILQDYEKGGK